jgi:transposase
MTASAAARAVGCSAGKAEHWLHRFNAGGFATFAKSPGRTGRPIIIDGQQVRALIRVALSRPEDLGLPFTQWSVSKLRAYCLKEGLIPPITDEWVRRLLRREGVSYQHTKTWKQSPDPEFEVKKTLSSTSTNVAPRTERSSASTSAARSN